MKYKYMPQTGIKCPAITRKGKECPIGGEEWRNGWCHVHDPNGEMVNKTKRKVKAFSLEYNLREIIATTRSEFVGNRLYHTRNECGGGY